MRPICPPFSNPTSDQVLPPSVDLYMPLPIDTLPRGSAEPVPTYITLGSLAATRMEPMDPTEINPSVMLVQFHPPSSVRHTPPPVAPIKKVCGRDGIPATAVERPPRAGPIFRYFKWDSCELISGWAGLAGATVLFFCANDQNEIRMKPIRGNVFIMQV